MKKLILALVLLFAGALPAAAQGEPSAEEMAAAREVLRASQAREGFVRGFELGMAESAGSDMTEQMKSVIREVMLEEFDWDEMEPEYARLYADLFTLDELRQLTAFYNSPVGRRMAETSPELAVGVQRIVNPRLQAVLPRLMQRVMEQASKEEGGTKP